MKNVEWDAGAEPRKPVSLSVALAGTKGQFQFSLMSYLWVSLHVCILVCFCLGFVVGVFRCFFFFLIKDVYIFGNDRNVVQIYFCLCCSTFFFFLLIWEIIFMLVRL